MTTRCKPGDLAIVVQARNADNVGLIVRVVGPFQEGPENQFHEAGVLWLCECSQPMTWVRGGRTFSARTGPIPDVLLQPIRGQKPLVKAKDQEQPISLAG